jgi:hypothetical protein
MRRAALSKSRLLELPIPSLMGSRLAAALRVTSTIHMPIRAIWPYRRFMQAVLEYERAQHC